MNNQLLLILFLALGITSCIKQDSVTENLNSQWTLVKYSNILGQFNCQYYEGDITWSFEDDKVKINGQLITPWELTPCYVVDSTYTEDLTFVITESDNEDIIYIEDLDLEAKLNIEEELVIEIISSSGFVPSTEGVKVFFKRI